MPVAAFSFSFAMAAPTMTKGSAKEMPLTKKSELDAMTKGSAKELPLTKMALTKKNELDAVSKVQTTVGGPSLWADMSMEAPSTKDDSDGAASGGSELETVTGTDRTGKSRSSATKSSGRKRNRLSIRPPLRASTSKAGWT